MKKTNRYRSISNPYRVASVLAITFTCQALPSWAVPNATDVQTWQQLQSRGDSDFYVCEYGNAERLLKQAVIKARTFGPGDLRLAKSAGELGHLLAVRGRFAEAQPYLEEELQTKQIAIGNNGGELIPSMGSLVRFYLTGGTESKADPLADELLSFVEGTLRGASTQSTAKYQKGVPLQGWAGQASTAVRDPLIEWAITCDDLGNLYCAHGGYDMADRLYKAALDVKATVLGKQHLSLANSYDSLGSLCLLRKENGEAESYFKDALSITERIQPPENPQVYSRLDKLAKCLIKEGKYPEAEALYLRAQDFWKTNPSNNGNEARALFSLGSVYVQEKNFAAAAPVLEQALQYAEQFNGPASVALVPYLQRYAYTLYYLGRRDEVEPLNARANALSSTSSDGLASTSERTQ